MASCASCSFTSQSDNDLNLHYLREHVRPRLLEEEDKHKENLPFTLDDYS